jgi:Protein of unknown function (DUF2630)
MDDDTIIAQISALAEEEQRLEEGHAGEALSEVDHRRLHTIEVTLDQLWDLLRQRRAKRDAGQSADDVRTRSPETVEGYLQ